MTIIVADTTCGLPHKLLAERGILVIPQVVIFGEESYHDDEDFNTAEFLQKLKASSGLPKTAAPPPSLYFPIYDEAQRKRGERGGCRTNRQGQRNGPFSGNGRPGFPGCGYSRGRYANDFLQPGFDGPDGG